MTLHARLSSINLNLLVALDALLREKSVTRAAVSCGVTQSAMSQTLGQLRDLLDDPVLVRSGRQMVLTPRAEAMAPRLAGTLGDLSRVLVGQVDFDPLTLDRRMVIGANTVLAWLVAVPLYERLHREAPNVEIIFDSNGGHLDGLRSGTLDFVADFGLDGRSGIRSQVLFPDSMRPVLRQGHPLAPPPGGVLSYETWASIPHVLLGTVDSSGNPMDAFLASKGLSRTIAMCLPSALACAKACAETDLCWNTASIPVRHLRSLYPLVCHRLPDAPKFGTASLYWHARWQADHGHGYLRQVLYETIMALEKPCV